MATQVTEEFGLRRGTPDIKSVGPIAFSPHGIVFIADNVSARIFAIDLEEKAGKASRSLAVDALDARLAAQLGCSTDDVDIRDLAVSPVSQTAYLSVMRGRGGDAVPLLIRAGEDGALTEVVLADVPHSSTEIPDAPGVDDERPVRRVSPGGEPADEIDVRGIKLLIVTESMRSVTVTDLAYADGTLLVAGTSNEEFVSRLRRIPFPFGERAQANALEIFHVSHGKYETEAPVRKLVAYGGNLSVLASYTCTPVVHFSLEQAAPGSLIKGRTVAELGSMNTPLDMVAFESGGSEYVLVANSRHPLFKLACADIDRQDALTQPTEPVGVPRVELPQQGVSLMAVRGGDVVMLQRDESGRRHLRSYAGGEL
jgi:hypothetical protein